MKKLGIGDDRGSGDLAYTWLAQFDNDSVLVVILEPA